MPIQEQLEQVNKQVNDGLVALNQVRLEQEDRQADIVRMEKALVEKQAELDAIESSLDTATTARSNVLAEVDVLRQQLAAAKAELDSTLTQNEQAKVKGANNIRDLEAEQDFIVKQTQQTVEEINAKKDALEKELQPLTEQIARFNEQQLSISTDIMTLNAKRDEAAKALEDVSAKAVSAQEELTDLQTQAETARQTVADKKDEADALDAAIVEKTAEVADLEQKTIDLQSELEKNSLQNVDYLKARANVIELQTQMEQRLEKLKMKYGEFNETWD